MKRLLPALGLAPFAIYVLLFLAVPTLLAVGSGFFDADGFTLRNLGSLFTPATLEAFGASVWVSALTAVLGALIGAVLCWALAPLSESGPLRRVVDSASSVLAQFGGVMLAFSFIAVLGKFGNLTRLLADVFGVAVPGDFLASIPGLIVVYSYFQIPLMVIVFLPAVDGLRPEWRAATANLGGSGLTYWARVAVPILAPSFLGCLLLLFANAFSAYATAAALISQRTIIVPMAIEGAIRNENNAGMDAYAQALATGMIVVVALVMGGYALIQRRATRWQR